MIASNGRMLTGSSAFVHPMRTPVAFVEFERVLVSRGVSLPGVMREGRWRSVTMVARYAAAESVGEPLAYLEPDLGAYSLSDE